MLPPGVIVLKTEPFFYYDERKDYSKKSMNDAHYHNFHEVYYLMSGNCDYLIDDKVYSLSEGSLIFIPSGVVHKTTYTSDAHERIVLSFNDMIFHPDLNSYLNNVRFCTLKKNNESNIKQLFQKMSHFSDFESQKNRILIHSYLSELLMFIVMNHVDIYHHITKIPYPIEYTIQYISTNFNEDISLTELASQFDYSTDHFSKLFRAVTGSGFKEYILLTRLTCAEKLLLTTTKSIKEIAFSCGFNDSNYFTYMFAKKYGISPTKYKHLKNNM